VRNNVRIALLCIAFVLYASAAHAQVGSDRGQITIQNASLRDFDSTWQLVAAADIQLSPEMRQGLNSGVPLQFIVDLSIKQPRRFWFDKTLAEYEYRYSLIYYELTRHYRLQSLNSNQNGNYRSLLAALYDLGRFQGVVMAKPVQVTKQTDLYAQLNVRLDERALPLPLQPLLTSTWRLTSEDYKWPLN